VTALPQVIRQGLIIEILFFVNNPPAKGGGFGLRLKTVSIGHSTNYPPSPSGRCRKDNVRRASKLMRCRVFVDAPNDYETDVISDRGIWLNSCLAVKLDCQI